MTRLRILPPSATPPAVDRAAADAFDDLARVAMAPAAKLTEALDTLRQARKDMEYHLAAVTARHAEAPTPELAAEIATAQARHEELRQTEGIVAQCQRVAQAAGVAALRNIRRTQRSQ